MKSASSLDSEEFHFIDLLTIEDIAAQNLSIYEKIYLRINPNKQPRLGNNVVCELLSCSKLPQERIRKYINLVDSRNEETLDKSRIFAVLKLIALNQNKLPDDLQNIQKVVGPPTFNPDILIPDAKKWEKYLMENGQLFDSKFKKNFQTELISKSQLYQSFTDSKIQLEVMEKMWGRVDLDGDGFINLKEYVVFMVLKLNFDSTYKIPYILPIVLLQIVNLGKPPCLPTYNTNIIDPFVKEIENLTISSVAPGDMDDPFDFLKPSDSVRACSESFIAPSTEASNNTSSNSLMFSNFGSSPFIDISKDKINISSGKIDFKNPPTEKSAKEYFSFLDSDKSGKISGTRLRPIFLTSGLTEYELWLIWNSVDESKLGYLNFNQFFLALQMISKMVVSGVSFPPHLTPGPEHSAAIQEVKDLQLERIRLSQQIEERMKNIQKYKSETEKVKAECQTFIQRNKELCDYKEKLSSQVEELKKQKDLLSQQADQARITVEIERKKINEFTITQAAQEDEITRMKNEMSHLDEALQNSAVTKNELVSQYGALVSKVDSTTHQINLMQQKIDAMHQEIARIREEAINEGFLSPPEPPYSIATAADQQPQTDSALESTPSDIAASSFVEFSNFAQTQSGPSQFATTFSENTAQSANVTGNISSDNNTGAFDGSMGFPSFDQHQSFPSSDQAENSETSGGGFPSFTF